MNRRTGFTLLEVLLALGLLVLLAGGLFGFASNLIERRDALAIATSDRRAAGILIDRLESDVLSVLAGSATIGSGIRGEQTSLTLLSRGVGFDEDAGLGDLQGTRIRFDAKSGTLSLERWSGAGGSGESEVLSDRVRRLRFRYFTGRSWAASFDSASSGLPVAIEVAIWFAPPSAPRPTRASAPFDQAASAQAASIRGDAEGLPAFDADEFLDGPEGVPDDEGFGSAPEEDPGPPDRFRVIVVPDGPIAAWRQGG